MNAGYEKGIEAALSHVGSEILKLESRLVDPCYPDEYADKLISQYSQCTLFAAVAQGGVQLEQQLLYDQNRSLIHFERRKLVGSIYNGVALGLRVAEIFLPEDTAKPIFANRPERTGHPSSFISTEDFLNLGDNGYEMARTYHELFRQWNPALVIDPSHTEAFQRAFGVVISKINSAWEMHMTNANILAEGDWVAAIGRFLAANRKET